MANYAPRRTTYDTGDRRWLPDMLSAETHGVSIESDLFPGGTFPKLIKSGTHIGKVTADGASKGHSGPYSNAAADGRQTSEGHLLNDLELRGPGELHHVAVVHAGTVKTAMLPASSGHDAAAKADLTAVVYL